LCCNIKGEANTEVFLHWDTNNALNAKIVTREDTYYIEVCNNWYTCPEVD